MATRRGTHHGRARAETDRDALEQPIAGIERFLRASAALQEALPLEQQVAQVLEAAREAVGVDRVIVWAIAPEGDRLVHVAASGLSKTDRGSLGQRLEIPLAQAGTMAKAYRNKTSIVVDETHPLPSRLRLKPPYSKIKALRTKSFVVAPIIARGRALGLLLADNKYRRAPLPVDKLHLLPIFALHLATAVDNARLFPEHEASRRELAESLEQQTATSEILRAISSSRTDLRAVLQTVAESAAHLCNASDGLIFRLQDERLRVAAHYGSIPTVSGEVGLPISREHASGRAVIDHRVVHLSDVLAEPDAEFAAMKALARRIGYRTVLVAPMFRGEAVIGTISIRRTDVRPFTENQVDLLKTFADQAAIAIENTRLFEELESRNRDLTESLEQQTATSDILRVISSSPTNLQPVLNALVESGVRLCHADNAAILRPDLDGHVFRVEASCGSIPGFSRNDALPITRALISATA